MEESRDKVVRVLFFTYKFRAGLSADEKVIKQGPSSEKVEIEKINADVEKERLKLEKKKAKMEAKVKKKYGKK